MGAGSLSKLTIPICRLNMPGASFVVWEMVRLPVFVLVQRESPAGCEANTERQVSMGMDAPP